MATQQGHEQGKVPPKKGNQSLNTKAVQQITPLLENNEKIKEWNVKLVKSMGQADPLYGKALTSLMKWADAEVMPDMESGWPGSSGRMSRRSMLVGGAVRGT